MKSSLAFIQLNVFNIALIKIAFYILFTISDVHLWTVVLWSGCIWTTSGQPLILNRVVVSITFESVDTHWLWLGQKVKVGWGESLRVAATALRSCMLLKSSCVRTALRHHVSPCCGHSFFSCLHATNTEHISITLFYCCANYRFQTSKTLTVGGIQLLGYECPLHLFLCCSTKSTLSIEQNKFVFVPSTNKSTTVWLWMPVLAVYGALLLLLNCHSRELNGCTEKKF